MIWGPRPKGGMVARLPSSYLKKMVVTLHFSKLMRASENRQLLVERMLFQHVPTPYLAGECSIYASWGVVRGKETVHWSATPPVAHLGLEMLETFCPKRGLSQHCWSKLAAPVCEHDSMCYWKYSQNCGCFCFSSLCLSPVAGQVAREISTSAAAQSSARGLVDCARGLSKPPSGWPPAKQGVRPT